MIYIKTNREIEQIRKSSVLLAKTLKEIKENIRVGVKTSVLSKIAEDYILSNGGKPAFKNYRGYPAGICVSLNEVVIHGIPSDTKIKDTDIVSIDAGVNLNGFFSDSAFTFSMPKASEKKKRLVSVTKECLFKAIEKFQVGGKISDISHQIQKHAEANGYSVVRQFVGHGVGIELHEDPQIPNFGKPGRGLVLKPGMIFAIEVMVNMGTWEVEILKDGWTTVTKDNLPSAHFEHTVYLSNKGPEILSQIH